jgi:hypothetical protein
MRSPVLWVVLFLVFCFGSWHVVEHSINADFRQQADQQTKQISELQGEMKIQGARAAEFREALKVAIPEKATTINTVYKTTIMAAKSEAPKETSTKK